MDDANDEMNARLAALKDAGAALLALGAQQYREQHPSDYERLREAEAAGSVALGLAVQLLPALVVQLWFRPSGGEPQAFLTLEPTRIRPDPRALN